MRIREIAAVRVRYGYQRIHILLRREGLVINRKRVYRLYKLENSICAANNRVAMSALCIVT